MGITGLLTLLKSIQEDVHLKQYRGKKIAVDTYSWLHKGVYSCCYELCLDRPTTKYINYCLNRVKQLLDNEITPIMVFDGANLPNKELTDIERKEKRKLNKQKGLAFLGKGNNKEAYKCFQSGVDVTPEMAYKLIVELDKMGVESIVSPYEADAQLAYLSIQNQVDCVISEDSDLLVFGCKCVLFKLNSNGFGKEIRLENLGHVSSVDFGNWTQTMLQEMCVMSGCDYLPSIKRIGIKKSFALINHYRSLSKAVEHLRFEGKYFVPQNYEENAENAVLTFKHQVVYDKKLEKTVYLNKLPSYVKIKNFDFLGTILSPEKSKKIAKGLIHPATHLPFEKNENGEIEIKNKTKKVILLKKKNILKDKTNLLTDYFSKTTKIFNSKNIIKINDKNGKKIKILSKIQKSCEKENFQKSEKNSFFSEKYNKNNEKIDKKIENISNFPKISKKSKKLKISKNIIKSPFLGARRISQKRTFGGYDFKIDIFSKFDQKIEK